MDQLRSFIRSKSSPKASSFFKSILNDSDESIKKDASEVSPMARLPFEVLENILVFAWHGQTSGLPGNGNFVFHNPRAIANASGPVGTSNHSALTFGSTFGSLLSNPHTKLSTANEHNGSFIGDFPVVATYHTLSLVCKRWRKAMYNVARMYVSIPSLTSLQKYSKVVDAPYQTGRFAREYRTDGDQGKAASVDDPERVLLARRLCRTIHFNIPTGNLSMIPSWSDIPTLTLPIETATGLTSSFDALTHIIFTVSEPHPAFFAYLAGGLPSSVKVLDVHISSPYIYKRPVLNRSGGASPNSREVELRRGLSQVKHLLVNVLDSLLLACILEGFGASYNEPSPQDAQVASILGEEPQTSSRRSELYSSPSLQTLTLHGPHSLIHPTITDTISHSQTIHTLTLYPHSPKAPDDMSAPCSALSVWNAPLALQNEAWLPALERLVVRRLPSDAREETELTKIKEVCKKRRVQVVVEMSS